ncbi:MAG: hypothetical protein ACRDIC_24325 [bacterium]
MKDDTEITRQAVEAFATLIAQQTGLRPNVHLWPGGDEHRHDADALVVFYRGSDNLRVLVEATKCLQGPIEQHGSVPIRLESAWHELRQIMASAIPDGCSVTVYWRAAMHEVLGRPVTDTDRIRVIASLRSAISQMASGTLDSPKVVSGDDLPSSLRQYVASIAVAGDAARAVTFRYPIRLQNGKDVYTGIPLSAVGIGPNDLNEAIMKKITSLGAYQRRAAKHRADEVWLLVVADGQDAASVLSPISLVGRIPDGIPALGITPNFDAVYLVARGSWGVPTDPLGPTVEWLSIPLLANRKRAGGFLDPRS